MSDADRLGLLKEIGGTKVYEERRKESLKVMHEAEGKRQHIQDLVSQPASTSCQSVCARVLKTCTRLMAAPAHPGPGETLLHSCSVSGAEAQDLVHQPASTGYQSDCQDPDHLQDAVAAPGR